MKTFVQFLEEFVPKAETLSRRLNQITWIAETTGHTDSFSLKADLETEYRILFSDPKIYRKLKRWAKDKTLLAPPLRRQLEVLILSFAQNQMSPETLHKISEKENELLNLYIHFRPKSEGKIFTENSLKEILKKEKDPDKRKKAWAMSKEIGKKLAPPLLKLVALRNEGAKNLGYSNFFQMQLVLQEVDEKKLFFLFEKVAEETEEAYGKVLQEIEENLSLCFSVKKEELGPWAWSEPFCQEDPLEVEELDKMVSSKDFIEIAKSFFSSMGFHVEGILQRSDCYEREGKNQHAFCINIDRKKDIRTLNNLKPTIRWLETLLHELGHAVYEEGIDPELPWLLHAPPHMMPTEAMALLCGRQVFLPEFLEHFLSPSGEKMFLLKKAKESLRRRQLIFSRWVLVVTYFEKELYHKPSQDLNVLWWKLVEKYQKIRPPKGREGLWDFAAKYHVSLAPVYYYSYLLGEFFASSLRDTIEKNAGKRNLWNPEVGKFLQEKLFARGGSLRWDHLVEEITQEPLTSLSWQKEFSTL